MAKYALNLADCIKSPLRATITRLLLVDIMEFDDEHIVNVEPDRIDGVAIVLSGPEERAEAIVKLIRARCQRSEWRCYKNEGMGWRAI